MCGHCWRVHFKASGFCVEVFSMLSMAQKCWRMTNIAKRCMSRLVVSVQRWSACWVMHRHCWRMTCIAKGCMSRLVGSVQRWAACWVMHEYCWRVTCIIERCMSRLVGSVRRWSACRAMHRFFQNLRVFAVGYYDALLFVSLFRSVAEVSGWLSDASGPGSSGTVCVLWKRFILGESWSW